MKKKQRTYKFGTHKKRTIFLWALLISSFSFAIYKNFTAVDQHTVHEKTIVEEKIVDTSGIQSYVKAFAADYFSWENNKEAIENRTTKINGYLTEELQKLNVDLIRQDIPTSSTVTNVQILNIEKQSKNYYRVIFAIDQIVEENKDKQAKLSAYETMVYQDSKDRRIIIQNPTITALPQKALYKQNPFFEFDSNVDEKETAEVTLFLETFFKLYPKASAEELEHYVKNNSIKPISSNSYIFESINQISLVRDKQGIAASFFVIYLDEQTKMKQLFQYKCFLLKDDHWFITNINKK